MSALVQLRTPKRTIALTIDGEQVSVPEGSTILDATAAMGKSIPTLCYLETLHPVNACRVCVVELEGSRVLVPSCSRPAEAGMVVHTNSERVKHSRKMVLEFLASSVDLSTTPNVSEWLDEYDCRPERYGPPAPAAKEGVRDEVHTGHHDAPDPKFAATVRQPLKNDNELYVRDYGKCILCYKCVEACGTDFQNTFAIAVAGRGFDARISTEFATPLPGSACVYCGNCIAVCPTGALMFTSEHDQARRWHLGRGEAGAGGHHLPVLRCGLHAHPARAGQRDREGDVALRRVDHRGESLHQGALRLALRAVAAGRARMTLPPSSRRGSRCSDSAMPSPMRSASTCAWKRAVRRASTAASRRKCRWRSCTTSARTS